MSEEIAVKIGPLYAVTEGIVECQYDDCGAPLNLSDVGEGGVCRYCMRSTGELDTWRMLETERNAELEAALEPPPKPERTLDQIADDLIRETWESEGECTETWDELNIEFEDKGLAYQHIANKLRANIDAQLAMAMHYDKLADKPRKRAAALEKSLKNLIELLSLAMRSTGKTEFKTELGKIYFQAFPVVKTDSGWAERHRDTEFVEEETSYNVDKKKLLAAFKSHLKTLPKGTPELDAQSWKDAIAKMPEGFDCDKNEKLKGV